MPGAFPDHARVNSSPQNILKDVFGYRSFRGEQQAIIEAALAGRDSLVIMLNRRRQIPVLPDSSHAARRHRAGYFAADRVDAGSGDSTE